MKKILLLIIISFQYTFAQNDAVQLKSKTLNAYEIGDYETVILKVNEMEKIYKQMPLSFLSLRIKAYNKLILKKPKELGFQKIQIARNLILNYLNNPLANKMDLDSYNQIENIKTTFDLFPIDETDFINYVDKLEKETLEKEKRDAIVYLRTQKLKPFMNQDNIINLRLGYITDEEFEKIMKEAKNNKEIEEKNKQKKSELIKVRTDLLKPYSVYVSYYDYNKLGEINNEEFDKILKAAKDKTKNSNPKPIKYLSSYFSNFGVQIGQIAKYGLKYESHSYRTFGFHIAFRTSLTSEDEILSGKVKENKTEIDLGPNFKISDRIYMNIGVGYGYFFYANRNDYAGILSVVKTGYFASSLGATIRINNFININGGASFMDLDKDIYKPEPTFGITFNFK